MITVLVAAGTQLLRQLLCDTLDGRGGLSVLATAPDLSRGLALVEDLQPDVAIVSMAMPEAEALVRALTAKQRRVVALGPCELASVAVVEDGTLDDVVAAIHGAMHGAVSTHLGPSVDLDLMTAAERRVLRLIDQGLSNKEIARDLGIAVPTVKHHVHSILTKLRVSRRGQAAAAYRRVHSVDLGRRPERRWAYRSSSSIVLPDR